jgi:hypothetical protein
VATGVDAIKHRVAEPHLAAAAFGRMQMMFEGKNV